MDIRVAEATKAVLKDEQEKVNTLKRQLGGEQSRVKLTTNAKLKMEDEMYATLKERTEKMRKDPRAECMLRCKSEKPFSTGK